MSRAVYLWVDQYGGLVRAATRKELREKCGGGRVSPMYQDRKDGTSVRCGYVVGQRWFTQFAPVETQP